jgi:hypothetical protein
MLRCAGPSGTPPGESPPGTKSSLTHGQLGRIITSNVIVRVRAAEFIQGDAHP